MTPDLLDIVRNPNLARQVPPESIPPLLGQLEALRALLWAQFLAPQARSTDPQAHKPQVDRLLTAVEAAPVLGVTPKWLHRHHKHLPFVYRLGRKALRFSEAGLRKWLATRNQGRTL